MIASQPRSRRPKPVRRFPPEVLAPDEVRALLVACNTQSLPGQRNRALLAFVYRTGLRIREALEVRPKDLDLERGAVRVLYAKGGRSRTVGIDAGGVAEVATFYEAGVVKCEDVICWSDAGSCGHCGVARGLVQLSIQAYTVAGLESLAGIVPGAVVLVHFVQGTDAHLG